MSTDEAGDVCLWPESKETRAGRTALQANQPSQLHRETYDPIHQLSLLPGAEPGITESILDTLAGPIPA